MKERIPTKIYKGSDSVLTVTNAPSTFHAFGALLGLFIAELATAREIPHDKISVRPAFLDGVHGHFVTGTDDLADAMCTPLPDDEQLTNTYLGITDD